MNKDSDQHIRKREAAPKVFENLKEYHKLVGEMNVTALQLLANPKATANEVMQVHEQLARTNEGYRKTYQEVKHHFWNYEPRMWDWGRYTPLL